MEQYTGQMIGGPDDGNFVTSSVTTIPIVNTVQLWLDGPDKTCSIITTKGVYIWQENKNYFLWSLIGSEASTQTVELV